MLQSDAPAHKKGWIPALDGIRGLAVLLVIVAHCFMNGPDHATGHLGILWFDVAIKGAYGVDLFFVLSGFLITGILMDTLKKEDYFRSFYFRRVLRILPIYFIFLFCLFGIFCPLLSAYRPALYSETKLNWLAEHQGYYWSYCANWLPLICGGTHPGWAFIGHFWSLCVEEQFYLIWPLLIWIFGREYTWLASLLVLAVSISMRALFIRHGLQAALYTSTVTHMDGLALGSLAAYIYRSSYWDYWVSMSGQVVLLSMASLSAVLFKSNLVLVVSLLCLCLILGGLKRGAFLEDMFSIGFLRNIGRYSYAMYVFHFPLTWLAVRGWKSIFGTSILWQFIYTPIILIATYLLARASWYLIEERCLRLKTLRI